MSIDSCRHELTPKAFGVGPTAKIAVLRSPELDSAFAIARKGALAIPRKH